MCLVKSYLTVTAIMLVDPDVGDQVYISNWNSEEEWRSQACKVAPYIDGYLDFSPWSLELETSGVSAAYHATQRTLRQGVVYHWKQSKSVIRDPLMAFSFGNLIIASQWMLGLEYLSGIVSGMETRLWKFEEMPQNPSTDDLRSQSAILRKILADVNKWRRRTWWLLDDLKENIEVLKHTGPDPEGISGDILNDFQVIKARLEDCRQRIESLLPTVIGTFSLLEAQYSSINARFSTWIAGLAAIFVPLSISSGIFALSGDFQPGKPKFWAYWAVAIPLMVVVFMIILAMLCYRRFVNKVERRKNRKYLNGYEFDLLESNT